MPSPQGSSKKQRSFLSNEEKQKIYDFYVNYRDGKLQALSRARKVSKQPKRRTSDSFVLEAFNNKPREFAKVSKRTWFRVVSDGKKGGKYQKIGRPTSLTFEEEYELSEFIKKALREGYLITDNAIVIWAFETVSMSPRFNLLDREKQISLVEHMGGVKWVRHFKKRHGIKISKGGRALEGVRALKTQPEEMVNHFRNLLKCHALAQIHSQVRTDRVQDLLMTYEGIRQGPIPAFPSPLPPTEEEESPLPDEHEALDELRQTPALSRWEPGMVSVDDDTFFFQTYCDLTSIARS